MKVVINKCYGGFGISTEATKRLIARQGKSIVISTVAEYTAGRGFSEWDSKRMYSVGDGFEAAVLSDVLVKDGMVYTHDDSKRSDPDLVAVVEEMGEAANGEYSELKVVEIPDDVQYTIEEYDGREWIAEVHSTWN